MEIMVVTKIGDDTIYWLDGPLVPRIQVTSKTDKGFKSVALPLERVTVKPSPDNTTHFDTESNTLFATPGAELALLAIGNMPNVKDKDIYST